MFEITLLTDALAQAAPTTSTVSAGNRSCSPAMLCIGDGCGFACWLSLVGAVVLSAVVGYVELLQRYSVGTNLLFFMRDGLARCYLVIHSIAGGVAWVVLPALSSDVTTHSALHASLAGLGALAVLRLSFMNVGTGDKKISIGPGALLDILIANLDQRIDQNRATLSIEQVAKVMHGLNFDSAVRDLTAACAASMERLPEEAGKRLGDEVTAIHQKMGTEDAKLITLGTVLRKYVGLEVLTSLVAVLRESLSGDQGAPESEAGLSVVGKASDTLSMARAKMEQSSKEVTGNEPG